MPVDAPPDSRTAPPHRRHPGAGTDAPLVLPHYLVAAPQDGLTAQPEQLAARTRLPLVACRRGQVVHGVETLRCIARIPNVIGVKDGHGDLDRLQRLTLAVGAFFTALRDGDQGMVEKPLREFYVPFVELRDRAPGYAVSLVKAAARLRGQRVGPVRAPLTDHAPADLAGLQALLTAGLDLVGASL